MGERQGGPPDASGCPTSGLNDFRDLLLPAAAFALVAFADLIATVRTFAQRHGYDIDANRELTALGSANVIGGLTSAFPVSSSNSRSAVNDAGGARSQAAVIVAAAVVGLFLLFAMPLIKPLPNAASQHASRRFLVLLSNLSTAGGHKTDTSETTRETSRDASSAPRPARFAGETVSRVIARVRA